MTKKIFVISDTHFGHKGICTFLNPDGTKMRPFETSEEMDEEIVRRWNSVVGPNDKVYHLGDVAIPRSGLKILERLNGDLVLIKGNHDIFPLKDYIPYFRDIRGAFFHNGVLFTHVPIHPESKGRFLVNIHGHNHKNEMTIFVNGKEIKDEFYINVCAEFVNYTPVLLSDLMEKVLDPERLVRISEYASIAKLDKALHSE